MVISEKLCFHATHYTYSWFHPSFALCWWNIAYSSTAGNEYRVLRPHWRYVYKVNEDFLSIPVARRSMASRLLGLRLRILQWPSMSLSCECCVLSGRGRCGWLITRPEESYKVWNIWVWQWRRLGKTGILMFTSQLEKNENRPFKVTLQMTAK